MSVILGIQNASGVIIAADRRGSTKEGEVISDELEKIVVINNHLAYAAAGNSAIQNAIKIDIEKDNKKNLMTTEDVINCINNFYERVRKEKIYTIMGLPFVALIAGKNCKGNAELIRIQNCKGKFSTAIVPVAIISPADIEQKVCDTIFASNLFKYREHFAEKIIEDISNISRLVSKTGNKWVYNARTDRGELFHF